MMSRKLKGRFWFCPVYWEPETETLYPRILPGIILELTLWLHHSMLFFAAFIGYEIDEYYPIRIYKERT
jgi:hypothetical protein